MFNHDKEHEAMGSPPDHCSTTLITSTGVQDTNFNESTQILLAWLCLTIERDGGSSLVTSLKDHYWPYSPKRLNQLLVDSPIGKPKLLLFLEHFCEYFQVDRHQLPHWVTRTVSTNQTQKEARCISFYQIPPFPTKIHQSFQQLFQTDSIPTVQRDLLDKFKYILTKRYARISRRRDDHEYPLEKQHHIEFSYKVNLHWLISQCPWQIHAYLRAIDYYRKVAYPHNFQSSGIVKNLECTEEIEPNCATDNDIDGNNDHVKVSLVVPPASVQWQQMVLKPVEDLLLSETLQSLHSELEFDKEAGKVWIKEQKVATLAAVQKEYINSQPTDMTEHAGERLVAKFRTKQLEEKWLDQLEEQLTRVVEEDGATQISLAILLHRYPAIKQLLGGHDLWNIVQQHTPGRFCNLDISIKQPQQQQQQDQQAHHLECHRLNQQLIIRSRRNMAQMGTDTDKRMKVDTVGLFSVTNKKWSTAIANIMINACKSVVGWDTTSITVIDMTASVGGMVLGFAKAKTPFAKSILAMEIDSRRAKLCQENMEQHGVADRVQVLNVDSVAAIESWSCSEKYCILIDPPWGGENYKQYKDAPPLNMGPWSLEDVLERISKRGVSAIVGLRLPVTLAVEPFLQRVQSDRDIHFEILLIRKLSVQLFAVLKFEAERII